MSMTSCSPHVPPESAGFAAGARPGWRLVELDGGSPDDSGWLVENGGAAALAARPERPAASGRPAGRPRLLTAADPSGRRVFWEDEPATRPSEPVVDWRRLDAGKGYIRIGAWLDDVDEAVDAALRELCGCEAVVVDLRRNPGGSLSRLAEHATASCARRRPRLDPLQHRLGCPLRACAAERGAAAATWPGRLIVLTDELTFSSAEDFLLGLQGLEHVRVVGVPSGGGSGRPRVLRLLPAGR